MKIRVVDYNTAEEQTYKDVRQIYATQSERIAIYQNDNAFTIDPKEKFIVIEEAEYESVNN